MARRNLNDLTRPSNIIDKEVDITKLPGMRKVQEIMNRKELISKRLKEPEDILLQAFKQRAIQIIDGLEREAKSLIVNKNFSTENNESQLESIRIDLLTTKANLINLEIYE